MGLSNSPCNRNNQPNSIKNCNKMSLQGRLGGVMCAINSSWAKSRMLRELRIDRNAFEDLVNAVADLPLQRRGRRAFVFSHRERVLFLHAFLAFGLNVAHMLLLPRIKSPSEVNAIAKRIASQYADRMHTLLITQRNV